MSLVVVVLPLLSVEVEVKVEVGEAKVEHESSWAVLCNLLASSSLRRERLEKEKVGNCAHFASLLFSRSKLKFEV